MEPNIIPITPMAERRIIQPITGFEVKIRNVILFTSADLEIALMNGSDLVDYRIITISGTDYTNWAGDDNYIINWVKTWIQTNYPVASS